jgi:hypothetical protein
MRFFPLLCVLLSLGLLSACGVKPKNVEKPEGKENVIYPRTYPSPETDPRP